MRRPWPWAELRRDARASLPRRALALALALALPLVSAPAPALAFSSGFVSRSAKPGLLNRIFSFLGIG